jgi:hypothetical protein
LKSKFAIIKLAAMNEYSENNSSFNAEMEIRLWNYIDGIDDAEKKSAIEKLINENTEWRVKYQELLQLHELMYTSELEHPSMRFTKNVMEEIAKHQIAPAAKEYIDKKIIWGIAGFFITLIISFIVYGIMQVNWSEGSTDNGIGIDFSKIDYTKMFNNNLMNGFMIINVILGLILFDRYLAIKKQKLSKEV